MALWAAFALLFILLAPAVALGVAVASKVEFHLHAGQYSAWGERDTVKLGSFVPEQGWGTVRYPMPDGGEITYWSFRRGNYELGFCRER